MYFFMYTKPKYNILERFKIIKCKPHHFIPIPLKALGKKKEQRKSILGLQSVAEKRVHVISKLAQTLLALHTSLILLLKEQSNSLTRNS